MSEPVSDTTGMLEAHVRFELDRFTGPALDEAAAEEVAALFAWLGTVRLANLATPQQVTDLVRAVVAGIPADGEGGTVVQDGVRIVHAALQAEETTVGQLLRRQDYDRVVRVVVDMHGLRREVMDQVTKSAAYARLISHVLYQGVKSYVLTENVLARRIPGASSLVRLGQRGLSSAAPSLEKGIDKKLTSFVNANAQDTIQDSQRYLEEVLVEPLTSMMAEQTWAANEGRTLSSFAALIDAELLLELVGVGRNGIRHLRDGQAFPRIVRHTVDELFRMHGDRPAAELLGDVGVTEALVTEQVRSLARRVVDQARDSGYLEARIRSRLAAFYASYDPAGPPASRPRPRKRAPTASDGSVAPGP